MFMETSMKSNCHYIKKFIYRYPDPLFADIGDFDSYFKSLDKDCRRDYKRSYKVKKIDKITSKLHKDILSIYGSKPTRQGREINYQYLHHTGKNMDIREGWPHTYGKQCPKHYFDFYGCFDKSTLVAFLELLHSNELTLVYSTMGHADYLKKGVMRRLFIEAIRQSGAKYLVYGDESYKPEIKYFLNDLKINQVDPLFIYELSDPC